MPSHVIRVVQRVEAREAGDAARRVKQYILQVYKYAKTIEIAERNPAADIGAIERQLARKDTNLSSAIQNQNRVKPNG